MAGYELISVLGSSPGKIKPLSSTAEDCHAQQGWWVHWGQRGEAVQSCVLCNKSFNHMRSLYILPKTLQESLQHALLRSLCPFFYLHFHSVPFLCACSHQSYLQILGYKLLTVVSLQITKYFMVSSFTVSVSIDVIINDGLSLLQLLNLESLRPAWSEQKLAGILSVF